MALQDTVHTAIVCSAGRWLTEPKYVADGKLLMNLCLDLCLYSFINSTYIQAQALLKI